MESVPVLLEVKPREGRAMSSSQHQGQNVLHTAVPTHGTAPVIVDEMTIKREHALTDLKALITNTLASKMEEMKNGLTHRMMGQEDVLAMKIKKIEGVEDDKKKDSKLPVKQKK